MLGLAPIPPRLDLSTCRLLPMPPNPLSQRNSAGFLRVLLVLLIVLLLLLVLIVFDVAGVAVRVAGLPRPLLVIQLAAFLHRHDFYSWYYYKSMLVQVHKNRQNR